MPTREILEAYRASRDPSANTRVLCHAPFLSLNFEQNGRVTSCCYNRQFVLGTYPKQSVGEIWRGSEARALREAFLQDEEALGCDLCFFQLKNRNFGGTLMRNFDRYARDGAYAPELEVATPRVLEFEIANTCNLECVMCAGHWSSAIRAHREHLPPLKSPYDRAFVDQLEEFLPSLVAAKFLGGEPFLIKRYYEIWERIRQVNPEAELTITTNGSIVPERARELLEELRACISVSLDALTPSVYEKIRKNARHEQVMQNVEYFLDYTRRRGTWLTLTICPMTYNWQDLPRLLEFCEKREIQLHFNTVLRPAEASLGGLSAGELDEVINHLEGFRPEGDAWWTRVNRGEWEGLVSQLHGWREEKREFAGRCVELESRARSFASRAAAASDAAATADAFGRLLPSLVRSLQIARERASVEHLDFLTLLPRTPIALGENGERASTAELLLAVHLFCRFLDEAEARGGARERGALAVEQRGLLRHLDSLGQRSGHGEDGVAGLDRWLRERIRLAEADALVRWMRALLETLERPDGSQGALGEGLAELRQRGLDAEGSRRVAAYLDAVVSAHFRGGAAGLLLAAPWPAPAGPSEAPGPVADGSASRLPPVRDGEDLGRLLDALYLFHRCYEPAEDHAAFRRRLDAWLAAVRAAGREAATCGALARSEPTAVYALLAHASDDAALQRTLDTPG